MLAESRFLDDLQQHAFSPAGNPMCIYGDPAYPLRLHLQAPFREMQLTPEMEEFNRSMSSVRIAVEWIFGDIINYVRFLDFKKKLKDWFKSNRKIVYCWCTATKCFNMSLWKHNI